MYGAKGLKCLLYVVVVGGMEGMIGWMVAY